MHLESVKRKALTTALLAGLAGSCTVLGSQAQGQGRNQPGAGQRPLTLREKLDRDGRAPDQVPGELVVRLAPGADVDVVAQAVGGQVRRKLGFAPNTYVLKGVQGDLGAAAAAARSVPGVLLADPNALYRSHALPTVLPNDPLRSRQFGLNILNSQDTWGIAVGERFAGGPRRRALVAVIDTAFDVTHPDLEGIFDANSYDIGTGALYDQNAQNANFLLFADPHGQQMSGCVAVKNNNREGIASLPWEGVNVLAVKAAEPFFDTSTPPVFLGAFFPQDELTDAIYYAVEQGADVISMSLGGRQQNAGVRQAVQDAHSRGVVLCASSGNGRSTFSGTSFGVNFPAAYPEVIAVGAVGPNGELAFYSDGGAELELMSPGGNDITSQDPSKQIVTTTEANKTSFTAAFAGAPLPVGYDVGQGTSPACAFLGGAIGTLITQGILDDTLAPPERVERVRQILRRTATPPPGGRNDDFGFGIVNVGAALREFTQHIDVIAPTPNEISASFAEPITAQLIQPRLDRVAPLSGDPNPISFDSPRPLGGYQRSQEPIDATQFTVRQNGSDVSQFAQIVDPNGGLIDYEPQSGQRYSIGNNNVDISFGDPSNPGAIRRLGGDPVLNDAGEEIIPARAFRFRVFPRVEQPGIRMMSLPFKLQAGTDTLPFLFGGNLIRLARWQPETNEYAVFDTVGSPQDDAASLTSSSAGVANAPVGLAFWARVVAPTQTQVLGRSERGTAYRIPLKPGFNMIGTPYPFRVPLQLCSVQFGPELLTISEAVSRNLVRNTIWRYEDGRYTFKVLPQGELVDFEGHWIRAFRNVDLIVPRVPSILSNVTASSLSTTSSPPAGGWRSTISAKIGDRTVGEVFVGRVPGAAEGYGQEDVETPPSIPGGVDLQIRHTDWGRNNGVYAQDLRSSRRGAAQWNMELQTSRPDQDVQLTWQAFPGGVPGYIQVEGVPGRTSVNRAGSVRIPGSRGGKRRITLVTQGRAGS
jgi:hypothetical protein